MKPAASRRKGRNFEKQIAKEIQEAIGLDKDDVTISGIFGGEDIKFSSRVQKENEIGRYSIEVKKREKFNIWDAIGQCIKNANGKAPLIIFSRNHEETYVTLRLDRFLDVCNLIDQYHYITKGEIK